MKRPTIAENWLSTITRPWQRATCEKLVDCTLAACPDANWSIKWRHPYVEHHGALVKWFVAKEHINFYFFSGRGLDDRDGLFAPTENAKMMTVVFREGDVVAKSKMLRLLRAAVALNRAKV